LAVPILAALYPCLVIFLQSRGVRGTPDQTPATWGVAFESVTYETADGVRLKGWWVPAPGDRAVLLLHGKGGYRMGPHTGIFELGRWYRMQGYSVLLPDLRAHGESGGVISHFGAKESDEMAAWIDAIDPQGALRWRLHGFSMGAVTALLMNRKVPGRFVRVIADSPWIDFEALVRQELRRRAGLPFWTYGYVKGLAEHLFGLDFETIDPLRNPSVLCAGNVRYLFGSDDSLLPPLPWQTLRRICPDAKITIFAGAGHVAAFKESPEAYTAYLESEGL
jgi:pimeloyl-ACP methyl ester carboxylesterase